MTSLTMYSEWTAPTMLSKHAGRSLDQARQGRAPGVGWVRVVDTTVRVFYPW